MFLTKNLSPSEKYEGLEAEVRVFSEKMDPRLPRRICDAPRE
jgi:hypothetical protein